MADSWRYTPESVDPGRKAGTPRLGSPGYWEGLTDSFQESQNDFSGAHHDQSSLWVPHALERHLSKPTVRSFASVWESDASIKTWWLTSGNTSHRTHVVGAKKYNRLIIKSHLTLISTETIIPHQTHTVALALSPPSPIPAAGPLACPKYPGGGIGGITRLKGIGMFIAVTWLGPALIIPIWSWVWKYMLDGRPGRGSHSDFKHPEHSEIHIHASNGNRRTLSRKNNIIRNQKLKGQAYHCQEPLGFLVPYLSRTPKSQRDIMRSPHPIILLQHRSRFLQHWQTPLTLHLLCRHGVIDHRGYCNIRDSKIPPEVLRHHEHFQFLTPIFLEHLLKHLNICSL